MGRDILVAGEREMRTHGRHVASRHLSSRGAPKPSASRTTDEANLFILLYNLMSKLCKYYKCYNKLILHVCLRNFRAEDVSQRCPAPRELIS